MTPVRMISTFNVVLAVAGLWLASKIVRILRRRAKTTPLRGPDTKSWLFGVSRFLSESKDPADEYEIWAEKYGAVYGLPAAMGARKIVLYDPKAISHFYSRETFVYQQMPMSKIFVAGMVGRGVLWAEGESHKRQRKALTPAFSNAAIRKLTPVFFDSAYKVKAAWDTILESSTDGEAIIDVQNWMNHVSLDSVGIAGFSHNFGTLEGKRSTIADVFDTLGTLKLTFMQMALYILSSSFSLLMKIPTERQKYFKQFSSTAKGISEGLLAKTRKEKEGAVEEGKGDHSVMGLLIKAENEKAELRMSEEEVLSQMKVIILAGYETTSISLTWALIELSKKKDIQTKLREELISHFSGGGDATYDQLTTDLPYLDAVVHETLRLHPPLTETTRMATEDDIIPLSVPIQTADNKSIDRISVAAGQLITVPIGAVNKANSIWGSDGKEFKPQRWLAKGGIQGKAKEIQGYRHLLTFSDGPRACLGRSFALSELKAVLSTLIRNYTFELRDGPDTKFARGRSLLSRPKVEGEEGCRLPLRVRRVD